MSGMKLGLIILLTGIVVVFGVLVLLIFIIKMYSTAVSNAQSKIEKMKKQEEPEHIDVPEKKPTPAEAETVQIKESDDMIPGEIIAAIAAAVDTVFGEGAVTVTSVKKAKKQVSSCARNAWRAAGMAENTRAF